MQQGKLLTIRQVMEEKVERERQMQRKPIQLKCSSSVGFSRGEMGTSYSLLQSAKHLQGRKEGQILNLESEKDGRAIEELEHI